MAAMAPDTTAICLGVITAAHGVRGLVKIKPFTAEADGIYAYGPVRLDDGRQFTLRPHGSAKGLLISRLEGIVDRDQAEALKGALLYVEREKLPPAGEDEIYQADLIGTQVTTETGEAIGKVIAVFDFGAGELLEISRPRGASVLVPFNPQQIISHEPASGLLSLRIDPVWLDNQQARKPDRQ